MSPKRQRELTSSKSFETARLRRHKMKLSERFAATKLASSSIVKFVLVTLIINLVPNNCDVRYRWPIQLVECQRTTWMEYPNYQPLVVSQPFGSRGPNFQPQVAQNPTLTPTSSFMQQPTSISLSLSLAPTNVDPFRAPLSRPRPQPPTRQLSPIPFILRAPKYPSNAPLVNNTNQYKISASLHSDTKRVPIQYAYDLTSSPSSTTTLVHQRDAFNMHNNIMKPASIRADQYGHPMDNTRQEHSNKQVFNTTKPLAPYEPKSAWPKNRRAVDRYSDHQPEASSDDEIRTLATNSALYPHEPADQFEDDRSSKLQFVAADLEPQEPSSMEPFGSRNTVQLASKPEDESFQNNAFEVDRDELSPDEQAMLEADGQEQTTFDETDDDAKPIYKEPSDQHDSTNSTLVSDLNTANADESAYLAAQLPSQYESAIRLPPEGYYDDYYKPGFVNQNPRPVNENSRYSQGIDDIGPNVDEELRHTSSVGSQFHTPTGAIMVEELNGQDLESNNDKPASSYVEPNELGNLRVIVADTSNSSRDPNKHDEKLINYTNESQSGNVTTPISEANKSSPRLTFFNKDMNESNQANSTSTGDRTQETNFERIGHKTNGNDNRRSSANKMGSRLGPTLANFGRAYPTKPTQAQQVGTSVQTATNRHHSNHRPQVTEAHLDPNSLIMKAPTKAPKLGDGSLIESLSKIPSKVKEFHKQQPDKNELMNELLTALDRVKVAIYRLQPLTAKMNAIYRKSVASNTRDTIMDSNKGTYAKRYPPGDYDDSYDRIPVRDIMKKRSDNNTGTGNSAKFERRMGRVVFDDDIMDGSASESAPSLVFEFPLANQTINSAGNQDEQLSSSDSQIMVTGIGHRLGDGQLSGQLELLETSITETGRDDIAQANELKSVVTARGDSENDEFPLFGYRVTIYQSPDASSSGSGDDDYNDNHTDDLMATSESSIVETRSTPATPIHMIVNATSGEPIDANVDYNWEDEQEAEAEAEADGMQSQASEKKLKKKKDKKSKEIKEKKGQEKEEKSKEMKKKHLEHKKMNQEESKRKKEYKKIKHNKGVVSKEKKTMKRDKQVKAHDRGAAKEKALKERTQIEFFEREQIVDDEFEKGKKSTIKAGWETGHDAKKSKKSLASDDGDTMSLGGSHFVNHMAMNPSDGHKSEKGSAKSELVSSSKKSDKMEKRQMEAKGKKLKGWREKGYKIITETEFIDRGSLHDSAYKKRDKGASQHHKYKKHEASSEGHQGSMHEHMKKSNKKEEKKSKMQEKKEKHSKKNDKEKTKKDESSEKESKIKKKKKKNISDDQDAKASRVQPKVVRLEVPQIQRLEHPLNHKTATMVNSKALNSTSPIKTHLIDMNSKPPSSSTLSRLINANHHEQALQVSNRVRIELPPSNRSVIKPKFDTKTYDKPDESKLLRDKAPTATNSSINSTLLDIIDTVSGRQVNKAKLATYDLYSNDIDATKIDHKLASNYSQDSKQNPQTSRISSTTTKKPHSNKEQASNNNILDTQPSLGEMIRLDNQLQYQPQFFYNGDDQSLANSEPVKEMNSNNDRVLSSLHPNQSPFHQPQIMATDTLNDLLFNHWPSSHTHIQPQNWNRQEESPGGYEQSDALRTILDQLVMQSQQVY